MSADAQKRLIANVRSKKDCPDSIALSASALSASDKSWLSAMTVEDVKVTGTKAMAELPDNRLFPPRFATFSEARV